MDLCRGERRQGRANTSSRRDQLRTQHGEYLITGSPWHGPRLYCVLLCFFPPLRPCLEFRRSRPGLVQEKSGAPRESGSSYGDAPPNHCTPVTPQHDIFQTISIMQRA